MSEAAATPIWQVDAFTDAPFRGNPAAVCVLPSFPTDQWMQHVAAEMNLAETAFVVPRGDSNQFDLRWFTPAVEVDLCGHATLAAAHVLWEQGFAAPATPIEFETRSGSLCCVQEACGITLDFPATPPVAIEDSTVIQTLAASLGLAEREGAELPRVWKSRFDLMVILDDERQVRELQPNMAAVAELDARGVIVTAEADMDGVDFVSRFFAPQVGVSEDPVTGSAHCCLAPYWAQRLGRPRLVGYQASVRGGRVGVAVEGDRVRLTGAAVTMLAGNLLLSPGQMERASV